MNILKTAIAIGRERLASRPSLITLLTITTATTVTLSTLLNSTRHQIAETSATMENKLIQMHDMGYESGYQSAIVDSYTGSPRYLIEEDENDTPVMWKRIDLDDTNRKLLADRSSRQLHSELSASAR